MSERLPVIPLSTWIQREFERLDGDETIERGSMGLLAEALGISERLVGLWRDQLDSEGRPVFSVRRDQVEDALDRADVPLWAVFPWLNEDRLVEGWCTSCDELVKCDGDLRCLWCGGPTAKPMPRAERVVRLHSVCPACRGQKSRGALRCRPCAVAARPRDRFGRFGRCASTHPCAGDCGKWISTSHRRCWPCYQAAGGHTGRKHTKSNRSLQRIDEETLRFAYDLYRGGLSLRKTAAEILDRTTYASAASCAQGLCDAFGRRGWPKRDRTAAIVAMNKARAEARGLPICGYEKADGTVCEKRTSKGRCWHHRPENLEARLSALHHRERIAA